MTNKNFFLTKSLKIFVIGAYGGRIDHTLSNFSTQIWINDDFLLKNKGYFFFIYLICNFSLNFNFNKK